MVVDTETTGSNLWRNGQLQRRVTIIPLNKIQSFRVSAEKVATAKKLGPSGSVDLALNLIGSDAEVSKAMEFVFGNTFICVGMSD